MKAWKVKFSREFKTPEGRKYRLEIGDVRVEETETEMRVSHTWLNQTVLGLTAATLAGEGLARELCRPRSWECQCIGGVNGVGWLHMILLVRAGTVVRHWRALNRRFPFSIDELSQIEAFVTEEAE